MFTGRVSLDGFVEKFHDSKIKGTAQDFMNEVAARAKERFATGTPQQKADSLQEILFLQMQGYDASWVEFDISNLMACEDYSVKMMAYLAASQLWEPNSEAIFMSTNCIKRDLESTDPLKKSLALSILPLILTPELANHVVSDVVAAFNHSRPEVSQQAITTFYQICLKFPDALRAGFATLNVKAKLEEGAAGTQQAVLTLLNELCIHNPRNFVNFIPTLYKLLTAAASPWILVRTLSIFTMILASLEPETAAKLAQRLVQPVAEILDTAASASVVLEVIRLICDGPLRSPHLIKVAADRAQDFIENADPNLHFLGLTMMTRLMKIDQKVIASHKDIISNCLENEDPTCVVIAVDLLQSIATRKNLADVVLNLVSQIQTRQSGYVRDVLVQRVIEICTYNDYERVTDFEWYINVLFEIQSCGVISHELSQQLLSIALRVETVREVLVKEMNDFMADPNLEDTELIEAAAFIIGEYGDNFDILLSQKVLESTPTAQSACIQNAFKLFTKAKSEEDAKRMSGVLKEKLPLFAVSRFTEVQERATMLLALVGIFSEKMDLTALHLIYNSTLKAVATTAQAKVPIPSTLDIATPIVSLDAVEQSFDFIDEMKDEAPNASIFLLGKQHAKKVEDKKPSNVVVVSGTLGVELQPKKRRLQPLGEVKPIELLPVEGAEADVQKQKTSALSQIDITTPLKASEKLPELLPYSQEELIQKQSRQLLPHREERKIMTSPDMDSLFQQSGEAQGLSLVVTDVKPVSDGLIFFINITNSSPVPISAVEFSFDKKEQGLRQEIPPNESASHRLTFKSQPIAEVKKLKVVLLPTGGAGDPLRGFLVAKPSHFLSPGQANQFDDAFKKCTEVFSVQLGEQIQVQATVEKALILLKGTMIKKEAEKIIGVYSVTTTGIDIIGIIKKAVGGFVFEIRSSDKALLAGIAEESKTAFAESK